MFSAPFESLINTNEKRWIDLIIHDNKKSLEEFLFKGFFYNNQLIINQLLSIDIVIDLNGFVNTSNFNFCSAIVLIFFFFTFPSPSNHTVTVGNLALKSSNTLRFSSGILISLDVESGDEVKTSSPADLLSTMESVR